MKNYDELKYIKTLSEIVDNMEKELKKQGEQIKFNQRILIFSIVINIVFVIFVILIAFFQGVLI